MWRCMWSFKAAFLSRKPRRKMSDAGGASELFPGQMWKRHIVHQLHNRDRNQHEKFRDLIRVYSQLLEKTSLTKVILSCSTRRLSSDSTSLSILMHQKNQLKKTTGELAFQVVELQQQIKIKECLVEEQHARLHSLEQLHSGALDSRAALQRRVESVQADNSELKGEYDVVLERQRRAETRLREEKLTGSLLVEQMVHMKKQQAARMNSRNQRKSRAREANLQKELQKAVRSQVTVDSCSSSSAPSSRSSSPNNDKHKEPRTHTRLFRSSSASSPRILSSIRELFEKRRGHSVSLEEDLMCPMRVCLSARIPTRARHVLEAHEQGINAVSFSCSSDLLATGGTDRVIKLWEVTAGQLTHRATLGGSSGGITCIQFDPQGSRVLAASYDKSALLWRLDDSVPKLTLTGHRRKVTAARFSSGFQTVVTGSADGSIRLWDLHRAACVQDVEVSSFCSDVVCSENCVISGHYDSKIRVWDTRTLGCVQVLPSQDKVTSLDLSLDHRQLLSCCRDDCLQLADLRGRSYDRVCFRAEGFKCGSDSTKAVISPDGCFLAAGGADGAVYIWNVSTGNLETRLPDRHSSSISAVAWSLSGEYFVSVDKSRMAVLWSDF